MIVPTVKGYKSFEYNSTSKLFATMATAPTTTHQLAERMDEINSEMVGAKVEQNHLKEELERVDEQIAALQQQVDDKDNLPIGTSTKEIQDRLRNAKTERKKLDSRFQDITARINELSKGFTSTLKELAELTTEEMYDLAKQESKKEIEELTKSIADLKIKRSKTDREETKEERDRTTPPREEVSREDRSVSAPPPPPRTRSLAQLPILLKAADFTEHIKRVKTYFRLNAVVSSSDKKDLLLMSFSTDLALRIQGISPNEEPYLSMDFEGFCGEVKLRMIPRASSSILRTQFEHLTQKADEYIVDYLLEKQALFAKAYPPNSAPMPVSFLTRHLMDGVFNETLKSELWRQVADDEETNESSDPGEITSSFNRILQKTNSALDFVRRTNNVKGNQDRKGLSLTSPSKSTGLPIQISQYGMQAKINQVQEEEGDWEEDPQGWASDNHAEEGIYTVGEEDDADEQLTEEQVNFCRLVEEEEQTRFWEEGCEEAINELKKEGGRRMLCWVCSSDQHLKKACPTRLKVVSQRVNEVITPGQQWRRGGSRGGRTWRRSSASRGGRGRASTPSAAGPFGFGRGGGQFYPPGVRPTYFPSQPKGYRGQHF